ncbi:hypothetical protein FA95DRAFT_789684 [Auriscalpium vulgare]|uniref:Uncharacterized protein n=1 Tax=Auriscalpium vulgare TaxID=40419 RepID=A0ACB8RA67_9AGAM|nr:hypothetical protein FA95DRAFT_789684 [Auriscalpium vulgare]
MSQDGAQADATEEEESEELKKFRQQWREEVQRKKGESLRSVEVVPTESSISTSKQTHRPSSSLEVPHVEVAKLLAPLGNPPSASSSTFISNGSIPARRNALAIYKQAVKCEQASELDEALRLYRQAFRMDPDVDRMYFREETQAALVASSSSAGTLGHKKTTSADHASDAVTPDAKASTAPSVRVQHIDRTAKGGLATVLRGFPEVLKFEPEDETASTPIEVLPDELLVSIISFLGTSAIERFGTVSRKARVVTLDSTIWRALVEAIYKPPQIPPEETIADLLDQHGEDYRRTFIEQPRVRLDGVYIAVCHYVREGHSENAWVNISHLITYHRYLRFYPNGQVISLLANEEHEPQQIITVLRPTLRMKGFFIGSWRLEGTTIYITDLVDPSNSFARYAFQMTLQLRSRPLGRWNRLDFEGYDSVNIGTGEATPLALKNERPFWFSKVKSYSTKVE